jgi:hypothetical protein
LLFLAALSIWTFKMGGNGVVGIGVSNKGGNDVLDISAPCSIASNNELDLDRSNSWRDDDFGIISKS